MSEYRFTNQDRREPPPAPTPDLDYDMKQKDLYKLLNTAKAMGQLVTRETEYSPLKGPLPKGATLEVNYDLNPTELYHSIESKAWDIALQICDHDPIQAMTWVVRVRKNNPSSVRWRLLPLHAAVVFKCPGTVVRALLTAYPEGAKSQDDQGMLPLHLAFRGETNVADEDIITLLLEAYPQGVGVKDKKGRSPLTHMDISKGSTRKGNYIRAYSNAVLMVDREHLEQEQKSAYDKKLQNVKRVYDGEIEKMHDENIKMKELMESMKKIIEDRDLELEAMRQERSTRADNYGKAMNMRDEIVKTAEKQARDLSSKDEERERMIQALASHDIDTYKRACTQFGGIVELASGQRDYLDGLTSNINTLTVESRDFAETTE